MDVKICYLLLICTLSLFSSRPAGANEGAVSESTGLQEKLIAAPTEIDGGGSYSYSVPLDFPGMRGMEPNMSLAYDSSRQSNGSPDATMGIGWQLGGLSKITRSSLGGGAPTFENMLDVFRLDGSDLVACKAARFDRPYIWNYPEARLAERFNASCSYGKIDDSQNFAGNMTMLREDYRRIRTTTRIINNAIVREFVITHPNGMMYRYRSPGEMEGATPVVGTNIYNIAFDSTWLLYEIRDRQQSANSVRFYYDFDKDDGWAHRIRRISYGKLNDADPLASNNYNVYFRYQEQAYPLATYALGKGIADTGKQFFRLSSVIVKDGGTGLGTGQTIRGYQVHYAESQSFNRSLVSKIVPYGSDLALNADGTGIASGTALPSYKFTYNDDVLRFSYPGGKRYPDAKFHTSGTVADLNNDGRDEAIFYGYNRITSMSRLELQFRSYRFDQELSIIDQSGSSISRRIPETSAISTNTVGTQRMNAAVVTKWMRSQDGIYVPGDKFQVVFESNVGGSFNINSVDKIRLVPLSSDTAPITMNVGAIEGSGCGLSRTSPLIGNFDEDPGLEIFVGESMFDISWGNFVTLTGKRGDLTGYCDNRRFGGDEWVADIDGNGIDEIINSDRFYRYQDGAFKKYNMAGSMLPCEYRGRAAFSDTSSYCESSVTVKHYRHIVQFGDVNGDGAADAIINMRNDDSGNLDLIKVAISTGFGFRAPVSWIDPSEAFQGQYNDAASRNQIVDVNGDGLADLIWFYGYSNGGFIGASANEPIAGEGRIYLSTGRDFKLHRRLEAGQYNKCTTGFDGRFCIESAIGVGDFDGDGRTDLLSGSGHGRSGDAVPPPFGTGIEGPTPRVYFNRSAVPNLLTEVKDPLGKVTEIKYGPTSDFADNELPRIQHVVTRIRERGAPDSGYRETSYAYSGGRFNYVYQQPAGFAKITKTLPAIGAENGGPRLERTYDLGMATAGLILEERLIPEGVGANSAVSVMRNGYDTIPSVDGLPFRSQKTSQITGTQHDLLSGGKTTIFQKQLFEIGNSGQLLSEIDLGLQLGAEVGSLTDATSFDDRTTIFSFARDAATYIVTLPSQKVVQFGRDRVPDVAKRLFAEFYIYDGQTAVGAPPSRGNLTERRIWSGPSSSVDRMVYSAVYDASGNVIEERDANNFRTAYAYDSEKLLFRERTTDAAGLTQTTVWDKKCQVPLVATDPNGLAMTLTYDVHCREMSRLSPAGRMVRTEYTGMGNSLLQSVVTTSERHSSAPPLAPDEVDVPTTTALEYFNGFGEVYKTAQTGITAALADRIITLTYFSNRGQARWQSVPFSQGTTGIADVDWPNAPAKSVMSYDWLDRPTDVVFPNGAMRRTSYIAESFARLKTGTTGPDAGSESAFLQPGMRVQDEHCFDPDTATICGDTRAFFDHDGRNVRSMRVGGQGDPKTDYDYDRLGRLTGIDDPVGAAWRYQYDTFGNRTLAADPGLGTWALQYDPNGNLTRQDDAAGNVISFTYDALNRVTGKTVGLPGGTVQAETVFAYDTDVFTDLPAGQRGYNKGALVSQKVYAGAASAGILVHAVDHAYGRSGGAERENHTLSGGQSYLFTSTFATTGAPLDQALPFASGQTPVSIGPLRYDAAGRVSGFGPYITGAKYDVFSNPTELTFANGVTEAMTYDPVRGWLTETKGMRAGTPFFRAGYARTASGRISLYDAGFTIGGQPQDAAGSYSYGYDYAGRLIQAANLAPSFGSPASVSGQVFTNDAGGRIATKGPMAGGDTRPLTYAYPIAAPGGAPDHAPASVIYDGAAQPAFAFDPNGNMTSGLLGKTMTYDAENRPLSVTLGGKTTCYAYGADGTRLRKVELQVAGSCTAPPASAKITLYVGPLEIRDPGQAGEVMLAYPHPSVRLTRTGAGPFTWTPAYLHRDHLGSVRAITYAAGAVVERAVYRPYGEQTEALTSLTVPETKGWIGERHDADAGLQYLNARYYDPMLGLFLQPDWFEVMQAGVGTNRFGYAGGNPINRLDPSGNQDAPDMSTEEDKEHYEACAAAGGCQTGSSYAEDMANVCEAGGCAIVAIGLTGGLGVVAEAGLGTLSAAAGFALATEGMISAADGIPTGVPSVGKTAREAAGTTTTIKERKAIHDTLRDREAARLRGEGYDVQTEVTFKAGGKTARADIVASQNGSPVMCVECKTGAAGFERSQASVFGKVADGSAVPVGNNAVTSGFRVNVPLSQNIGGIPVYVVRSGGAQ